MSDTNPTPQATSDATLAPTAQAKPVQEAPAQEPDWKAEARKWEARAKENKSAAEKLAEIEEASKTAEQKAAERLASAEQRAAELESKTTRLEVAAEKGVDADLLPTGSREDVEAFADRLLAFKGSQPSGPRPDPSQGQGTPAALNGDPLLDTLKSKLGIS